MKPSAQAINSSVEPAAAAVSKLAPRGGSRLLLLLFVMSLVAVCAARARGQALGADNNRRYDQNAYLESHNAYTTPSADYICWIYCNQDRSIDAQLNAGVRALDLRIWKVRQFKYALNYQARIYKSNGSSRDTFDEDWFINNSYGRHDPEIVLGHHIDDSGLGYLLGGLGIGSFSGALHPLENYGDRLRKARDWLNNHPGEVVTLNVGSSVPEDSVDLTRQAFADAGLGTDRMFILGNKFVNVGLLPKNRKPGGLRPDPDGWWFPMDGLPTLGELISSGKRLVYNDSQTFDDTSGGDIIVDTVYGNKSVPSGCLGEHSSAWADANGRDIDDFRVPLFMMQHVRDDPEPTHDFTKCVQDIKWLKRRLTDIEARWHRLPNFVRIDHAAKTTEISGASNSFSGPKDFVSYLNGRWAEQPAITPTYELSPAASEHSWHNRDVTVSGMWGTSSSSTDSIQSVVYSVFGPKPITGGMPTIVEDRVKSDYPAFTTIRGEGKFVLSFYAVGSEGNASDRGYVDIWIDKTAPTIGGQLTSQPNIYGWYRTDVTATFNYFDAPSGPNDNLPVSGIDPDKSTRKVVLSTEGENLSLVGTATDKAGNVKRNFISPINLDKTAPTITYTGNPGNFTPDQFIKITCTPADGLSGLRVHTCKNVSGEGYNFVTGSQKITLHSYSAEATDYADNIGRGSTRFTVTVTPQAVSNLTARFVSNAGVANSLQQKLRQAAEAERRGDLKGKAQHVDVYLKELKNHVGRFVSAQNAATLTRLARAF